MNDHLPEVTALIRRQLATYHTDLYSKGFVYYRTVLSLDDLAEHIAGNLLTVYRVEPVLSQEKKEAT